jgi:S-adenosylmethionine-diacylglycerol 3-amino-3-carboxypropyl transferase
MDHSSLHKALQRPLAFAQTREDPTLDLACVQNKRAKSMWMIASGGCTAALIAASGQLEQLILVDINSAQLGLTQLKISLLEYGSKERHTILGHLPMDPYQRFQYLSDFLAKHNFHADLFGPLEECAQQGLDYFGRYEWLFESLRAKLKDQERRYIDLILEEKTTPNLQLIKDILRPIFMETFNLSSLQTLFSPQATQNALLPFHEHFLCQTLMAFCETTVRSGYFLSSMLGSSIKRPPLWTFLPKTQTISRLEYLKMTANEGLKPYCNSIDVIHLSNILDWLSEEEAKETLSLAYHALAPKGIMIVRQLNSNLVIPKLIEGLHWVTLEGKPLIRQDTSFFYRSLTIGTKGN